MADVAELRSGQSNGGGAAELPTETGLRDWVFLLMPEPRADTAREAFGRKWIVPRDVTSLSAEEVDETLWELGDAKRNAEAVRLFDRVFAGRIRVRRGVDRCVEHSSAAST